MMGKPISRRAFQALGFVLAGASTAVTVWWAVTNRGPWKLFSQLFDGDPFFTAMLSWIVALLPAVAASLALRRWADAPPLRENFALTGKVLSSLARQAPATEPAEAAAPLGRRAAAFLIDRAVGVLALGLCLAIMIPGLDFTSGVGRAALIVACAVPALAALAYTWARDAFRGQSLGRRLLKLQVIDAKTRAPIGGWASFKRELMLHFAPILAIELVMLAARPDRRRLGDLLAGTLVIDVAH